MDESGTCALEITPEMIQAGADVIEKWLPQVASLSSRRSIAEEAFLLMLARAPQASTSPL